MENLPPSCYLLRFYSIPILHLRETSVKLAPTLIWIALVLYEETTFSFLFNFTSSLHIMVYLPLVCSSNLTISQLERWTHHPWETCFFISSFQMIRFKFCFTFLLHTKMLQILLFLFTSAFCYLTGRNYIGQLLTWRTFSKTSFFQ